MGNGPSLPTTVPFLSLGVLVRVGKRVRLRVEGHS